MLLSCHIYFIFAKVLQADVLTDCDYQYHKCLKILIIIYIAKSRSCLVVHDANVKLVIFTLLCAVQDKVLTPSLFKFVVRCHLHYACYKSNEVLLETVLCLKYSVNTL